MPTIHFLGKIVPSNHYTVKMWDLPQLHYMSPENGLEVDLTIRIDNSSVDIECVANRTDQNARDHIHKVAYDMARATVNLASFSTGITLTVIFDQLINEDGVTSPFIIQDLSRSALCTAYATAPIGSAIQIGDITRLIMSEPALFLALDDLVTATSLHHLMTVNSSRSIEGLRHAMAPAGVSREREWEIFRTNLNLDKTYIRLITDHSISGRHGEGTFVPGTIITEIIKRSWTIMNRFLEFRKRGNLALPIAEFPLLTG
jgi:hypothetical protein